MCKKIEIFKDSRFGEIRTAVDENGNILFCLKDVCDALGIANNRNVMRYMDDPYVHTIYVGVETGTKAKMQKNQKKSIYLIMDMGVGTMLMKNNF